jgi:hypothetical protein
LRHQPAVRCPLGTVNLTHGGRNETAELDRGGRQLSHLAHAGNLGPGSGGLGAGGAVLIGWELVAAEMEEVVDPVMGREKTLRVVG